MSYEDTLIREATEEPARWCSQCERAADDCVCSDDELSRTEATCDYLDHVFLRGSNSGTADVCVPAVVSEPAQWEKAALREIDAI